jgi:UDP-GlcNAc:undecaprenyl-phosphate/decaprenyl-phosphate GlcNAc-1-phosphate transferase
MADGQNGIVIGMVIIWAACLTLHTGESTQGAALILLETAFVSFILNIQGRSFLGDSGSYGVGFVIGILAVRAHNGWGVQAETIAVWFFVPVFDCLRLIISRLRNGRTPFGSGRDHFHHKLEDRVGKNYGLVLYLGAIGVTSITATLLPSFSFICLISLMVFYFSFLVRVTPGAQTAVDFGEGNVITLERTPVNDRVADASMRRALPDE